MISIDKRLKAFEILGRFLLEIGSGNMCLAITDEIILNFCNKLNKLCSELKHYNGWYDEVNVRQMLFSLGESLKKEKLLKWVEKYDPSISELKDEKIIAIVMAGNIPAVGFHDFLSVLISGNKLLAKLSTDDDKLIPAIAELLISIEPEFKPNIKFTTDPLKSFDAVIATGSNNTSRYFDYYFSAYPHIIRKNRNGIAIISGNESDIELGGLASDIFNYYGLGCRNVSKVFIPENYDFIRLLEVLGKRKDVSENHKYFNNYEYNKAIFLVNGRKYFDTGNVLLVEDINIASPISVLNFEFYSNIGEAKKIIEMDADKIQCVITNNEAFPNRILFGKSQQPELWEYADGVDTVEFLLNI